MSATGVTTRIGTIAFSKSSTAINVTGGNKFSIPFANDNVQYIFSLPYDATLTGISGVFNNWGAITINNQNTHIAPFVAIATPDPGTYNFTIIAESMVYPETSYTRGTHSSSTVLTATETGMEIEIKAGTPIAIVGGLVSLGTVHQAVQQYIYMSGSLMIVGEYS